MTTKVTLRDDLATMIDEAAKREPELADVMFFFDVDNTLYDDNTNIQKIAAARIVQYFSDMGLDPVKAEELSLRYYRQYGLAIRGLIKHHEVDPAHYDRVVDGGLPLEELLTPSQELIDVLNRLKVKRWVFTNAGKNHATRVLKNLNITDQFCGMTYCDYTHPDLHCKPENEFFDIAMAMAKVSDKPSKCILVDDSTANCAKAKELGWTTIHITALPEASNCADFAIKRVTELPNVLPHLFKPVT